MLEQINKCILSKLWYTSFTIHKEINHKSLPSQCNHDIIRFIESETFIKDLSSFSKDSQYQWIICTLLYKLVNHVTLDVEYIQEWQKCFQITYALHLFKNLKADIQQELVMMYRDNIEQTNFKLPDIIQNEYLTFLKENVCNDPFVVCWIHNKLLQKCSGKSAYVLQNLYSLLIKELLELSKQGSTSENFLECILCIISRMNIAIFDKSTWLTLLFPMISRASNTRDIELALYSRTDDKCLFKLWSTFHLCSKPIENLMDASKIRKVLFHCNSIFLPVTNECSIIERMNDTNLHWIMDILETCFILTIDGKYDDVSSLLSSPLLKSFWPVLFIETSQEQEDMKDVPNDNVCKAIEFLLDKCSLNLSFDPILNELDNVYRRNLKLFKYMLNCTGECVDKQAEDVRAKRISIKSIFNLSQNFDSLLTLKMLTNIYDEQECKKIKNLFERDCETNNIFSAYYSMLCAIKAILSSGNYETKRSIMTNYFSDMNSHLKMIKPLDLRIETIANIFCLIFLRCEDFDPGDESYYYDENGMDREWMKQENLVGFICNKYAVKAILDELNEVTLAVENEYERTMNKNQERRKERIYNEIASIRAAITDAKWRLELYCNTALEVATSNGESVNDKNENKNCLSKERIFKSPHLKSKENILFYQEGNSSDETKTRSNSNSESELTQNSTPRLYLRKRTRNQTCMDGITIKDSIIRKPLFVNFMLATKESLIIRCLWKNDYTKAQDILEMSGMKNARLDGEVQFSKALHTFRRNVLFLKEAHVTSETSENAEENIQSSTLKNIRQITQEGIQSYRQTGRFETFLASQEMNLRMLSKEILDDYQALTICALDLALTTSEIYPILQNLCEVAMKYIKLYKTFDNTVYARFFDKFCQLLHEKKEELTTLRNTYNITVSVQDILCDGKITFSAKENKEKENFWIDVTLKHRQLKESQINKNTINKVTRIPCESKMKYMQNVCSHLQLLHLIIPKQEEQTVFRVSELFKVPLHYYFGYQIFELEVEPNEIEMIAHDLHINLAYSILTNACPLYYPTDAEIIRADKNQHGLKTVRSSLLQYLEGQCWLLSYLLQRILDQSPSILFAENCDNSRRTACLENLFSSSWANELKPLFENNQILAAIFETIPLQTLFTHFEVTSNEKKEWTNYLELLNGLPSRIISASNELRYLKDSVLSYIVSSNNNKDVTKSEMKTFILRYLYNIRDVRILSETVLSNMNKWHVNICEDALLHTIRHVDYYQLAENSKLRLNETLHRVLIFRKTLPYYNDEFSETNRDYSTDVAYCTEKIDPLRIVKSLINADKFELCLEWMECRAFSLEMHPFATNELMIGLLKSESQDFKLTSKFLQALPFDKSIKLCKTVLTKLESIDSLRFICTYLLIYSKALETRKYRRTLLGIDILSMLDVKERLLYIHLLKEPFLMLEQLLMNCKFESIQRILSRIDKNGKLEEAGISRSSFDEIIRFYAQKSLDCRVSLLQFDAIESKWRNVQYSGSENENGKFIMPIAVPKKEEWVPNDKARKCSCCRNVIFSMFNRRHHCRRCGRVICASCSQHRMQVPGYPSTVLVRVCDDCKRQTVLQLQMQEGTPSIPSSELFDHWRLTRDPEHNRTIKEEFSFEYAPNISLCLAILNLHSEHKSYTSFLLDRSDEMKRLLQPVSGGKVNPEVDHAVIIKMIRSLLVAGKVKCAKLGLNAGLAHCDQSLSQVDLIASLIRFDCLRLIPSAVEDFNEHTLRKLRDLLIEKEEWTLALDVSTKAGLDTQGVWASWGKACLKMGYFDQARDKFDRCLDKVQNETFDDWVILSYPNRESETPSKIDRAKGPSKTDETGSSRNRPLKDPPLLTEILQILDNLNVYTQHSHRYKFSLISNRDNFINVKTITGGWKNSQKLLNNNVKSASAVVQNIYYHENLYYLFSYGSCNSILEFFLKHEQLENCLSFVLENNLEPEFFFNPIYLYCLRNGSIDKLHETMTNKDSSLLIWKKYLIHVCHSLEKKRYLNILYGLQLFMKDSIRAAMTCIRFYVNEASNYTDLNARSNFLLDAQNHLESELQIESLNRKRRKSTSSLHSGQGILTMEMEPSEIDKHLNTICRQMEITKFLANCEKEERATVQYLNLFPGKDSNSSSVLQIPTLFDNQQQKIDLAVLAILCGRNIEEGFGIAFRIIQDYNLPQQKVYSLAGHVLTIKNNISAIEQLINCCYTSGIPNSHIVSDYVIAHCVKLLLTRLHDHQEELTLKSEIYNLIRLITDVELKINAYIECKQLKAAYLLAVKYSRTQDIRKILKESDRLGQNAIKTICIKWLQQEPKV